MTTAVRRAAWALAGVAAAAMAAIVVERDHLRVEVVESPTRNVITVTEFERDASGRRVVGEQRVYTEAPR